MRSLITGAVLLCLFASSSATSQSPMFLDLGTHSQNRIFVTQGAQNFRVGNAALVRLLQYPENMGIAYAISILAACDGSWLTGSFQFALKTTRGPDGKPSLPELLSHAKQTDEGVPLDHIEMQSSQDAQFNYTKPLLRAMPGLCKTAASEPRNLILPIAGHNNQDDLATSIGIVLGTSTRVGKKIDVWIRNTEYRFTPTIGADGKPVEFGGVVQKQKQATGKYVLTRTAFNCTERSLGSYELAEYSEKGVSPRTESIPRNRLALSPALPNSVGEAQLDFVCALYAPK
jgi:hypothetical protein